MRARLVQGVRAFGALACAGCGSSDERSVRQGRVERPLADASARSMARGVVQATERKGGPGARAQLGAGALQAESIVQPATREHSSGGGGVRLLATCGCI